MLISLGLSNRDIAARLTISVRTVEGHIHNAMAKTGTASREAPRGAAAPGHIKVFGLTGAVQGLVRILRPFPREIRVVEYSYARSQRTQQ